MKDKRKIGVLCHVTSLPSKYGIGDLGQVCFKFIDFLKDNNFNVWEILPLNKINDFNCPYGTISAFAFEELLIDLQPFIDNGVLTPKEVKPLTGLNKNKVDYTNLKTIKIGLLNKLYERHGKNFNADIDKFFACNKEIFEYCVFASLKDYFNVKDWRDFPFLIKTHDNKAIELLFPKIKDNVYKYGYLQMVFCEQFDKVKNYAKLNGIQILGDVAIYCEQASCDVWAYSKFFKLYKNLKPKYYGGVPSYMSGGAQNWGTCVYDWNKLKESGYSWWIDRITHLLNKYDILRLDHFVGLVNQYEIPANSKNINGHKWVSSGGEDFLNKLFKVVHKSSLVAEDFGNGPKICQQVIDKYDITSMRVALFAFDSDKNNPNLPDNVKENSVYYIGTHDCGTLKSFVKSLDKNQREAVIRYFNLDKHCGCEKIMDTIIKSVLNSKSNFIVFRTQDLLKQDDSKRMNIPGVAAGQWEYRLNKNYAKAYKSCHVLR